MVDVTEKSTLANNANRSVLSLTSPAKLNIMSSDWSRSQGKITKKPLRRTNSLNSRAINNSSGNSIYSRPPISLPAPPLIRRNSSFFADDGDKNDSTRGGRNHSSGSAGGSAQPSSIQETEVITSDRFIPTLQSNQQNKVDPMVLGEEFPPPNASPTAHLRAQTKMVFKQTVAKACGLDMGQRILQYMPQPPVASFKRQSYSMNKRCHYNYQQESQPELVKLRKINSNPERILDAPGFQDDFYLNLLSWSSKNVLDMV